MFVQQAPSHRPAAPPPRADLSAIASFLEAAVHQILHARGLYPPSLFEARALYGVPVWMSRHPELNAYIAETVAAARGLLERDELEALVVAVTEEAEQREEDQRTAALQGGGGSGGDGGDGGSSLAGGSVAAVERYVLEFSGTASVAQLGGALLLEGFRDALLRLGTLRSLALPRTSPTASFRLVLATPRCGACPTELQNAFVRAGAAAGAPMPRAAVTPLHDVAYDHTAFRMSIRAEEAVHE